MQPSSGRKILYGVHGYGRGHAIRAKAILPELARKHELLVLAGDDAYDLLHDAFPVVRIDTLRYRHDTSGHRSAWQTICHNTPRVCDLAFRGPQFQSVLREMRRFQPDVVISDSEAWTHHAARALGIPRISFDHYGVVAYCRLEMPIGWRIIAWLESLAYRTMVCGPQRIVVTAFYTGQPRRRGVRVVGPILRPEVRETSGALGEDLLVYFSNPSANFTPRIERTLHQLDCPVKVYGPKRNGKAGRITFCPISNRQFLRDLASCKAVFATAGNQLISESIHFGKPLLLLPEDSLEQRLNARLVDRWQIGMEIRHKQVTVERLGEFLQQVDAFAENIRKHQRDGLTQAIEAIEQAICRLAPKRS